MSEWSKVHAWKACVLERVPRVRIPLSPDYIGAVSEWLKEAVLKTVEPSGFRGFESPLLRKMSLQYVKNGGVEPPEL